MRLGDMLCPYHPTMTMFQCIEAGLHGPVPPQKKTEKEEQCSKDQK